MSWVQLLQPSSTAYLQSLIRATGKIFQQGFNFWLCSLAILAFLVLALATFLSSSLWRSFGTGRAIQSYADGCSNLAERLADEHEKLAASALKHIQHGLLALLVGIALMIVLFSVALFAPKKDKSFPLRAALALKIDELDSMKLLAEKLFAEKKRKEQKEIEAFYDAKLQEAYKFMISDSTI